jgi:hypothetical protein
MYQSVPSTFGISVMSGASRWLDAAPRGGMTVNATQKAIAHTVVMILSAILLAFSIGSPITHGCSHRASPRVRRDEAGADVAYLPDLPRARWKASSLHIRERYADRI